MPHSTFHNFDWKFDMKWWCASATPKCWYPDNQLQYLKCAHVILDYWCHLTIMIHQYSLTGRTAHLLKERLNPRQLSKLACCISNNSMVFGFCVDMRKYLFFYCCHVSQITAISGTIITNWLPIKMITRLIASRTVNDKQGENPCI